MLVTPKVMDALKAIGLNKYQRNLWAALLSRGASTAGELSNISNVPRSRCYDVLQSLAELGFVMVQPGKPMKYIVVPPAEAFERAKKKIQENAHKTVENIERLKKSEIIKELERLHKESMKVLQPEDMTGALKGRYALIQQLETMMKGAKKSIKLVTTDIGLQELVEHHLTLMKKAADNGVSIKIVAPLDKQNSDMAKVVSKYAQVRNIQDAEYIERVMGR